MSEQQFGKKFNFRSFLLGSCFFLIGIYTVTKYTQLTAKTHTEIKVVVPPVNNNNEGE